WLAASHFLLHEDVRLSGAFMALVTVAALLAAVISFGVSVSAVTSSAILGIAVLWMVLYGASFLLSLLPESVPSPDRALHGLPYVLRGHYDPAVLLFPRCVPCLGRPRPVCVGLLPPPRRLRSPRRLTSVPGVLLGVDALEAIAAALALVALQLLLHSQTCAVHPSRIEIEHNLA